jgi:hypothetical protein
MLQLKKIAPAGLFVVAFSGVCLAQESTHQLEQALEQAQEQESGNSIVEVLGGESATASGATADGATSGDAYGFQHPTFSPFVDLPELLGAIEKYKTNPPLLYYGPNDNDPWTNWSHETDTRHGLAKLAVMRGILDKFNLWDTYVGWFPPVSGLPPVDKTVRTLDGTWNDLERPFMGSAGARFGRNMMPLLPQAQPNLDTLMVPNPREVSRKLFTRHDDEMKEVPFLNLLAAAWIQFNVHDWFNHTKHSSEMWAIPLAKDDPFRKRGRRAMYVRKTQLDPTRQPHEANLPVHQNEVTHWWDGSQIYGSNKATSDRLRSFEGGRLAMARNGMLPTADDGFEDTGFRENWWVGLSLMHNLFAKEHNQIADMLAAAYPDWTDQQIFDKARMINAAVIVKIHTIEWTPAILPNAVLDLGMNSNWSGINQYFDPPIPADKVPPALSPVVHGIAGNKRDLKVYPSSAELQAVGVPAAKADEIAKTFQGEVPYSLTEEFVSVYRLHALLPDYVKLHEIGEGRRGSRTLKQTRDGKARDLQERVGMANLMYSFGIEHPGQIVLNNFPKLLQNLKVPGLGHLDIGAIDVLRDRERGVPRYNEFRRQLNLRPLASIDELTDDEELRAAIKSVYGDDIEAVDPLVGFMAEGTRPTGFGFGETMFQVFIVMATRRIQADRFYTDDYTPEVYTPEGMQWVENATMKAVLLRNYPELANTGLKDVTNAFNPWE